MGIDILKIFQMSLGNPIGHVTDPYVVGGAIIALKCKEGVVMATDTLLAYGSLLKYPDVSRYEKITDNVVIASSGEYADFQEVCRRLKKVSNEAALYDDNCGISAKELTNYLAHICYEKRNDFNPYYNSTVIAGHENGEAVLASVDLFGTLIKKDYVVTGFAKHFGMALIANEWNPDLSAEECKQILKKCFEVIYLRVCHSLDQIQFAVISKEGVDIEAPVKIPSQWSHRQFRERANEKLWQ